MAMVAFWLVTAFFALVLESLQLPNWLEWVSPSWLVLWASFWALYRPMKNQLVGVALTGLVADELLQFDLGSHMLALVLPVFLMLYFHNRIKMMSEFQKLLIVLIAVTWFYLALLGINVMWTSFLSWQTLFSVLATVIVWIIYQSVLQLLTGKVSKTSW